MTAGVIFPELLSGREDEEVTRPWTVREGSTTRGTASCNLSERILEVPLGPGAQARVVRAHELMHARVSPHVQHLMKALDEVSPRALECAEAVCFLMAVVGTGGEKEYLAGIRQGCASWLRALRAIRTRALALLDQQSTTALGSTRLNEEGLPSGYASATLAIARMLTQSLEARGPRTPAELPS